MFINFEEPRAIQETVEAAEPAFNRICYARSTSWSCRCVRQTA